MGRVKPRPLPEGRGTGEGARTYRINFMTTRITIRKPDDWHLHVRDGAMLKAVLPYTAKHFGRAILMPNLIPPVRTTADGDRLSRAGHGGAAARLDLQAADDLLSHRRHRSRRRRARLSRGRVHRREALSGAMPPPIRPPASPTTTRSCRVLERMEKIGMPFLMHGEDVDPDVDIFDREAMFIERLPVEMGEAVSRPAHDPRASVVEGRRRFRARARRPRSAAPSRPIT